MKKTPIGIESYKVLTTDCYFVDKTEFIHEVNSFPDTSVLLFTRPRRFGKSTNLSMLQCFYESMGEDPTPYFEGKAIARHAEDMERMGRYPVVYLSFKNRCPRSYEDMLREVASIMKEEYLRHAAIFEKRGSLSADQTFVEKVLAEGADKTDLSHSLSVLIRLLANAMGQRVVVLIDEYDALMQEAFDARFHQDAIAFFKTFYGTALKGNEHLKIAVLTGVFEIAKDSLSSSLNNPNVFTVLDQRFSSYFGFTEDEVKELLKYYGYGDRLQEILEWYGGYRFGGSELVNPWSVLNFISRGGEFDLYWTNTSANSVVGSVLLRSPQSEDILMRLMGSDGRISASVDPTISYSDLLPSRSAALSSLLFLGYVTIERKIDFGNYVLRIPNKEITQVFQKEIRDRFFASTGADAVLDFRQYLSEGNTLGMERVLESVILASLNYFDFGSEKVYQGMVLSLICLAYQDATVESEVNAGDGRCDILIRPINPANPGIILELKRLKTRTTEERMALSAQDALAQIKRKDYVAALRNQGVRKVLCYGVCFHQRKVRIEHETIDG